MKPLPYIKINGKSKSIQDWIDRDHCVYSQPKYDGMYCCASYSFDGNLELHTRAGTEIPKSQIPELYSEIKTLMQEAFRLHEYPHNSNIHLTGELLVFDGLKLLGRATGNGVINSILKGGRVPDGLQVKYLVWDLASQDSLSDPENTYYRRLDRLFYIFASAGRSVGDFTYINITKTQHCYTLEEVLLYNQEYIKRGGEGSVIKAPYSTLLNSKDNYQCKLKNEFIVDLEIVDFIHASKSSKNIDTFGSILCTTSDRLLFVAVSGISRELRQEIWDNKDNFLGRIISVKAESITQNKLSGKSSLSFPRFVEIRYDKSEADTLEMIIEQSNGLLDGGHNPKNPP
jgi:ATP-dependent DNA ligase